MDKQNYCKKCGYSISGETPYDLCPRCLMNLGLENEADATSNLSPAIEGPGTFIGHYKILEQIGEGGMGVVYLAEQQEPIKRKVALKIVKLGMDTLQVVSRFRSEQQMLAMLDHPNIAQVFDAGTTDYGRPYFVMEFVEGMPIIDYCDTHKLNVAERLKLFLQVCRAVQHAHQKGVLHRDIKPSNILVSGDENAPVPKIIDFGIAKAIRQPLIEQMAITERGQMLGTPEYMSPEQADMAYQDVDIRSDVYSLGVVLYELLVGVPPIDGKKLRQGGINNIRKIIHGEEPQTPSARLTDLANRAKELAIKRRTEPQTLAKRLKKELEWIPLKAMRKNPQDRYQSVSALAEDVSNYLEGSALVAGPQTRTYKIRIFVRKHAALVGMGALLFVILITGLISTTTMYLRADTMRTTALKERQFAEDQSEEYRRLLYIYKVALADEKCRDQDVRSARKLLKDCPEDLRNWEWHRLDYILDMSLMTFDLSQSTWSLALSHDGNRIASVSMHGITIKDTNSGIEILTINESPMSLAFSRDDQQLISGGFDHKVKVWDSATGEEIMSLSGHEGRIKSVAVSPDGKQIVSGSFDKTIKLWDASSGRELRTLLGHKDLVLQVAYSPDGSRIVSGSSDRTVRVWDPLTGKQLKNIPMDDQAIIAATYSPDGKYIAVGTGQGMIKILDAETGQGISVTSGSGWDQSLITSLAFSPDGNRLVSGGYDQTVRIWDPETGDEINMFVGHAGEVFGVAFMPDGQRIVSGAIDGQIKIWDVNANRQGIILVGHQNRVRHLVFSQDGKFLISSGEENTVKVWDVLQAKEIRTLRGHEGPVWKIAPSPDGKRIVSCSRDQTIRIWDLESGREVKKILGHDHTVNSVAISPDGKRIVSGSVDSVKVWDASTGELLISIAGHKAVHAVAFSPDGKHIAVGDGDRTIRIWDALTGREIMALSGHTSVICNVLFTPDGERLVSGAYDGTIRIWDYETGDQVMTILGHKQKNIESLAISPDGKRIVSGSFSTVKIWDASTGAELMTISPEHGALGLAFSPDGKTIAGTRGRLGPNDIILWSSVPHDSANSK